MIIRPVYNLLLLPDVTYYFKKDFFPEEDAARLEVGTEILFPFFKEESAFMDHVAHLGGHHV